MTDETRKAILDVVIGYHSATQGGSYAEEKLQERLYLQAQETYGKDQVSEILEEYNRRVIRGDR